MGERDRGALRGVEAEAEWVAGRKAVKLKYLRRSQSGGKVSKMLITLHGHFIRLRRFSRAPSLSTVC